VTPVSHAQGRTLERHSHRRADTVHKKIRGPVVSTSFQRCRMEVMDTIRIFHLKRDAAVVSLMNLSAAAETTFTKEHPTSFVDILEGALAEDAERNGPWLERLLIAGTSNRRSTDLRSTVSVVRLSRGSWTEQIGEKASRRKEVATTCGCRLAT
jgi:hypothetical protein